MDHLPILDLALTWSKWIELILLKEKCNNLPIFIIKFLAFNHFSCVVFLSSPQSLLKTLVDYFSEIFSHVWKNTQNSGNIRKSQNALRVISQVNTGPQTITQVEDSPVRQL